MRFRFPLAVLVVVVSGSGCSDTSQETPDAAAVLDVGVAADVPAAPRDLRDEDAAVDAAREAVDDAADVVPAEVEAPPAEIASPPSWQALPVAACGMPSYELLDPAELGRALAWDPLPFWTQSAQGMDGLLAIAGHPSLSPVPFGVRAYRLRYTTQDRGAVVEATALVTVPAGAGDAELPVALYLHGTTGTSDPCAPSHPDHQLIGPIVPALFAAMGYVTVAPDYIGMNGFGAPAAVRHAYLVGEQVALGAWDAVRAARVALRDAGETVGAGVRVVPWGVSQGGHAALFASLVAPYYAPEFEVPAVLSLVVPADLVAHMRHNVEALRPGTGLFATSLVMMHLWYGEQVPLAAALANAAPWFLADQATTLLFPTEVCEIDVDFDPNTITIEDVFAENFRALVVDDAWDALEPWSCFYRENTPATTSVPALGFPPAFVVLGEHDTLVDGAVNRPGLQALCDRGWPLDILSCAGADHVSAALWSLPEQFAWLADRLAGVPLPDAETCTFAPPAGCAGAPER